MIYSHLLFSLFARFIRSSITQTQIHINPTTITRKTQYSYEILLANAIT